MYLENTKSNLLVRVLRKQGWSLSQRGNEAWLVKGDYHIKIGETTYTLYCNVKQGDSLIELDKLEYGRRQSQSIKRAVEKHKKETLKCTTTTLGTKGERRS